jgi:aspartate/methionine/tyrosine aminotransferase
MQLKMVIHNYTHCLGMIELREEICRCYDRVYKLNIHPDQVVVTSLVMLSLLSTLISKDDACYLNFIKFAGGKVVSVLLYDEDSFQYRTSEIKKRLTQKSKLFL